MGTSPYSYWALGSSISTSSLLNEEAGDGGPIESKERVGEGGMCRGEEAREEFEDDNDEEE